MTGLVRGNAPAYFDLLKYPNMMPKAETLQDFYQHKFNYLLFCLQKEGGHFNVFRLEDCLEVGAKVVHNSWRDFYKTGA
jgi:hypothetical protein